MATVMENETRSAPGRRAGTREAGADEAGPPLERLEADLVSWASRLAAATGAWLELLAQYDRREGWSLWGCTSAAHWLSLTCGMSLRTGREHVRVARALEELPVVASALRRGELSYSKARALTRLVRPFDEDAMVELARAATGSQLDRIVAGCRQVEHLDDGGWSRRAFHRRELPDGRVSFTLTVPADTAELVEDAIDQLVGELDADEIDQHGGRTQARADTVVDLVTGAAEPPDTTLTIELDPGPSAEPAADPTSAGGRTAGTRMYLPATVVGRHACDATMVLDGAVLDGVGRRTRVVPSWLRCRLDHRDQRRCRFPGCDHRRRLHAHHIVPWARGGPTDLDNLILLCSHHHHLVHEGGWVLTGTGDRPSLLAPTGRRLDLATATAAVIAELITAGAPSRPLPEPRRVDPTALMARAGAGERCDHRYIVDTICEHGRRFRRTVSSGSPT